MATNQRMIFLKFIKATPKMAKSILSNSSSSKVLQRQLSAYDETMQNGEKGTSTCLLIPRQQAPWFPIQK